jgi:hypothetical protein
MIRTGSPIRLKIVTEGTETDVQYAPETTLREIAADRGIIERFPGKTILFRVSGTELPGNLTLLQANVPSGGIMEIDIKERRASMDAKR